MAENCLADAFGRQLPLTSGERSALVGLGAGERQYRRGAIVRPERAGNGELFVVQQGWLYCSILLEDGRRQIVRLHYRGDMVGADTLAYSETPDAVIALTDATIRVIDKTAFARLFVDHPRLAAMFFLQQQVDRVSLTDRLVSIGRSSAQSRVAALLLWIYNRLRQDEPALGTSFTLPLTQEEIGDATGLTAVHVNRTMRVLSEQGLIARGGGLFRILDVARMERIANHIERGRWIDTGWLPDPR